MNAGYGDAQTLALPVDPFPVNEVLVHEPSEPSATSEEEK
jgi:hypothetical protein